MGSSKQAMGTINKGTVANKKQLIIISGRSGAGKTAAMRALEDVGFFVVDNLPPQLLPDLLAVLNKATNSVDKVAIVVDARENAFLSAFPDAWQKISSDLYDKELLFLDASEQTIIERYQETRRRHPLDDGTGIKQALHRESSILEEIRSLATLVFQSDKLNSHELKAKVKEKLSKDENSTMPLLKIVSFGFKNGLPSELDFCFDVRFLPNPFYDPELKQKTGQESAVFDKVFSTLEAKEFLHKITDLVAFSYALFAKEGKTSLTIAIGCTGGQHRSVAMAQALYQRLKGKISKVILEHSGLR